MNTDIAMPDFDQIANIYWRLGVVQAPSQLQGYATGLLVVSAGIDSETLAPEQWLQRASAFIDAVEPPNAEEAPVLLSMYAATRAQLTAEDMQFDLLLPDDEADISQRVDTLGQWCQGFMAGFVEGGKQVQQQRGQQQYSEQVSEAISDLAAISQISLGEEDDELEAMEQNLVEIVEYLRVATQTIYLECRGEEEAGVTLQSAPGQQDLQASEQQADALGSPGQLFGGPKNKKQLH